MSETASSEGIATDVSATLEGGLAAARDARAAGDLPGALAIYAELRVRFSGATEPFRQAAAALTEVRHFEEADMLLEAALEMFPDDAALAAEHARFAQVRRDWPEAAARWDRARARFPDALDPWLGSALCLRDQGLMAEAEAALRQIMTRFPGLPQPWWELGWLVTNQRRLDEALVIWEQLGRVFPEITVAYIGGSTALRYGGRFAEARDLMRRALERFPDDYDILTERAWLSIYLGEAADAAARFAVLRTRFPAQANPSLGLARTLASLGRFDQAEAAYRAGIEAFPWFDPLRQELDELPGLRAAWTPPAEPLSSAASVDAPLDRPAVARSAPIRLAVAGHHLANQISLLFARMIPMRGKVSVQWLNASVPVDRLRARLPERWLDGADAYFEEVMVGEIAVRQGIRSVLPTACQIRTFPTSAMHALWPFQGRDARLVPEPPLYNSGRYFEGDPIAASLTDPTMTDDALFDMYMEQTEAAPIDLDGLYAADRGRWEAADRDSDVRLAAFLDAGFRDRIMFAAPYERGTPIVREVARQLLETPVLREVCDLETALAALDRLTLGWRAEGRALPVHPRVAWHFGLNWWSPDMRYRWQNNDFTFREHIIRYIRWSPWLG